ncbi:hypothetical protein [Scytonema millei]|uniref:Uncharacterized protein n=1 Tax=Scytonema millei VB511283 TaxID=1245923 RepID=A0A9X5E6C5_9CYAN|nr:hypothetical protein [Scytonema millei]NHC34857.1 hypothetical protein [Scytonema millei VB511283]
MVLTFPIPYSRSSMTTQFVTLEINLQESPAQLLQAIETGLRLSGEPLRWAITDVDLSRQKAIVEAIVIS